MYVMKSKSIVKILLHGSKKDEMSMFMTSCLCNPLNGSDVSFITALFL